MKKTLFIFLLLSCLLFFLTGTSTVRAHPADVYAHTINVSFSSVGLQIKWEIKPGPMLTSYLWNQADTNQNGILSQQEIEEWGSSRAVLLTATLDDKPLPLLTDSIHMPADLKSFQAGEEFITFNMSAPWPQDAINTKRLVLDNGMEQKTSINWFYLSAIEDTSFLSPNQKNHTITIDIIRNRALASDQSKLLTKWDSGTPSLPFGQQKDVITQTAEQVVPELARRTPQEILLDLIRTKEVSVSFYLFSLGVSLALGALHALTPGHGKTVVAAYLVGSRGTAWHAIVLGSVVTLTHTGSVFLLGIITLAASQYILPTSIIPWLEILSGIMIIGLGFYLLWQRFLVWSKSTTTLTLQERAAPKYLLATSTSSAKKTTRIAKIQRLPEKLHHHGDGKPHSHDIPETITWRSLITLGISGGLVPCPDAIAILLVAIAINRIFLGLALIASFSLGLAVVLIAIGLLMVTSSRLFKRMDAFNKFAPIMPILSAGVVLLLGFGLTYGAVSKLEGNIFLSIAGTGPRSVNEAQIIYQTDDKNQHKQLFITDIQGNHQTQLTKTAKGVVDFAISSDQKQVAYIEQTEDIEYNLWILDLESKKSRLAVPCKDVICGQPVWSPDGRHIVYEYTPVDGTSSLWWLDVATDIAQPVFQEARLPGINPRWSPNGEWLSYAAPDGIRLNHLEDGESRLIPNTLGAAVQWSPNSKSILMRDVVIKHDQFVTQLFYYDLSSGFLINLNANENMENVLAAWSPDGKSIAVVRRDLSIQSGDQIWLMNVDGSEARAITDTPSVLHGSLNWSPDGKYILYDLYLLDSFPLQSQLGMINIQSGEISNLNIPGYNPKWIW